MRNPVFDIENWREIAATLTQNKTRTFLTGFGIFWGTAMLALLLGGSDVIKGMMSRNFEGFATNVAVAFPGRTSKSYGGFNKGMTLDLNLTDIVNIRTAIPQIENSSTVNMLWVNALYGQKKSSAQLNGIEPGYARIFEPIIYAGRFINESDQASTRKVCVIGKKVADELFGSSEALGKEIDLNGIYYKVVGVVGQTSEINIGGSSMDESVYIPASSMRASYNLGSKVNMFMMTIVAGHSPSEYEQLIRRIVARNHPIAPDDRAALGFFDISEQFKMVDNLFSGITILALFVGLGTLLSGIVGIGNIMWIIVRERTHEIGIRRAIGAKPRDIIVQILSESMVLTTVAGFAGIVFAVAVLAAVEKGVGVPAQLPFATAGAILAAFLVLGTAAGIIPALKAMQIKPIEALNDK
ncbi:MAG: ABC transporter permease [Duncaniella sp.]|nr:ABC transporter permease [Duncaniella sp.]